MINKTFIKITNKDIYNKLEIMESHLALINGKVKLNRWISTTALTLSLLVLGLRFT